MVFTEGLFPVAELAHALVDWLHRPDSERCDFEFDSMSYAELDAVRITRSAEEWRVGSVFEPDIWTSPVAWEVLAAEIGQFVTSIRNDVAAIGVEPSLIPDLVTAADAVQRLPAEGFTTATGEVGETRQHDVRSGRPQLLGGAAAGGDAYG